MTPREKASELIVDYQIKVKSLDSSNSISHDVGVITIYLLCPNIVIKVSDY